MNQKNRNILDLVLNAIIVVCAVFSIGGYFFGGPDALGASGARAFRYFTIDSNILMGVVSATAIVWNIKALKGGVKQPKWLLYLKTAGTTAVSVTLFTVIFFLAPMGVLSTGKLVTYLWYFAGNTFILHFSSPVLAIISFVLLDKERIGGKRPAVYGLLPTVVYSFFYVTCVIILGIWPDFYGFTFGGHIAIAPVSLVVMYLFSYGLGAGLLKLRRIGAK